MAESKFNLQGTLGDESPLRIIQELTRQAEQCDDIGVFVELPLLWALLEQLGVKSAPPELEQDEQKIA